MTSEKIIFYPIGKDAFILVIVGKKIIYFRTKENPIYLYIDDGM